MGSGCAAAGRPVRARTPEARPVLPDRLACRCDVPLGAGGALAMPREAERSEAPVAAVTGPGAAAAEPSPGLVADVALPAPAGAGLPRDLHDSASPASCHHRVGTPDGAEGWQASRCRSRRTPGAPGPWRRRFGDDLRANASRLLGTAHALAQAPADLAQRDGASADLRDRRRCNRSRDADLRSATIRLSAAKGDGHRAGVPQRMCARSGRPAGKDLGRNTGEWRRCGHALPPEGARPVLRRDGRNHRRAHLDEPTPATPDGLAAESGRGRQRTGSAQGSGTSRTPPRRSASGTGATSAPQAGGAILRARRARGIDGHDTRPTLPVGSLVVGRAPEVPPRPWHPRWTGRPHACARSGPPAASTTVSAALAMRTRPPPLQPDAVMAHDRGGTTLRCRWAGRPASGHTAAARPAAPFPGPSRTDDMTPTEISRTGGQPRDPRCPSGRGAAA